MNNPPKASKNHLCLGPPPQNSGSRCLNTPRPKLSLSSLKPRHTQERESEKDLKQNPQKRKKKLTDNHKAEHNIAATSGHSALSGNPPPLCYFLYLKKKKKYWLFFLLAFQFWTHSSLSPTSQQNVRSWFPRKLLFYPLKKKTSLVENEFPL